MNLLMINILMFAVQINNDSLQDRKVYYVNMETVNALFSFLTT